MIASARDRLIRILRWSERYTKTDMVYLATGGFWLNLMTVVVSLLSFLLYVIFARYLPKETYGIYQYFISIYAIVGVFTLTGMNYAIVRATARGKEGVLRASIPIQLRWGLLPLLGCFVAALYYLLIGQNTTLALGLFFIGVLTPLITTFNSYNALMTGRKDFRRLFFYNLALNLPYYFAIAIAAIFVGNALVLLAVNLVVNASLLYILHCHALNRLRPNNEMDVESLQYGKHLSYIGVLGAVGQLDNVFAFHFLGAEALALYAFITAMPDRLIGFLKFIPSSALPKFSEKSGEEIRKTIGPKLIMLSALGLVTALVYAIGAPLFFKIFFPSYMDAVPYSQLYAFMMVGLAGSVAISALISQGRKFDLYILNAVTPVVQIALQLWAVIFYGLWGLVIAKAAATVLLAIVAWYLLMRRRVSGTSIRV